MSQLWSVNAGGRAPRMFLPNVFLLLQGKPPLHTISAENPSVEVSSTGTLAEDLSVRLQGTPDAFALEKPYPILRLEEKTFVLEKGILNTPSGLLASLEMYID